MPSSPDSAETSGKPVWSTWWFKGGVLVGVAVLAGGMYWLFGDELTLARLADREEELRFAREAYPIWSVVIAFGVYVAVTLFLPGATVMTLLIGWLFPWWVALVLTSFASTTGATLAMLWSRYLFRETIQRRYAGQLEQVNRELARDGAFYLFSLRLAPILPFFLINLVMGLTPIKVWTYWWVSQVGMLAGTVVYVTAGHSVPSLKQLQQEGGTALVSPQLLISLAVLGLFPLIARKTYQWIRKRRADL